MAPPAFADLGKAARDLISKTFTAGQWKVETKTRTQSGNSFKATSANNTDNGVALSSLESEFSWPDYGLKVVEKWNTDNQLSTELSVEDKLVQGLKTTFDTSFNPSSNKKKGIVKLGYKRDFLNTNLDVDFDYAGPVFKGSAVLGYQRFLLGGQLHFDTPKSKLVSSNVALGYDGGNYSATAFWKDNQDLEGNYYQKVSNNVELAVGGTWASASNTTSGNVAAKYNLTDNTNIKAKVTSSGVLSLAFQQKVVKGVSLTLSTAVDTCNFHAGGHRIGLALEIDQ